jgi:hypothetical protein
MSHCLKSTNNGWQSRTKNQPEQSIYPHLSSPLYNASRIVQTGRHHMDWQLAITRNRKALAAIIMALINSLGLSDGGAPTTLPVLIYTRALAILRPAESAVRRLIMIAAMQLSPNKFRARTSTTSQPNFALFAQSKTNQIPAFTLIDPLKTFSEQTPNFEILGPGYHQSLADQAAPSNTTRIGALTLSRRLLALKHALDTLPKQAKRLARWYATRDTALKQMQPHRLSPMRPGPPVGLPKQGRSEVQEVLLECHLLAIHARDQHDSS